MQIVGDVGGLRAVARSLMGVVPDIRGGCEVLSKRVEELVTDAGWSGDAAEEFKGAWEQDATAMLELAECTEVVATVISDLADSLESAQRQLELAISWAKDDGVPMTDDGQVEFGPYNQAIADAAAQFSINAQTARRTAQDARNTAAEELHDIAMALSGEDTSLLKFVDVVVLSTFLRGYYALPNRLSTEAKAALEEFNTDYKNTQWLRKHTPAGSKAKAALAEKLAEMRAARKTLTTSADSAERLAGKFKGGRWLGASVGDIADSLGVIDETSRASRLLDGLPAVDVVLGVFATWTQSKEDHEKGWSWTHAIAVDGGSNAAAITSGLATDCIPVVGPYFAPAVSYGVGAFTYEAGHEGHWTEHIHEDGVLTGVAEGTWDSTKASWDNDVVGVYHKATNDLAHPGDAAKSLWHGVVSLF